TGKVEYLYMDFGTVSAAVTNAVNATPITFAASSHVTDNIVRAGVNYKFDPAVGGYDLPPDIGVPLIFKAPAYGAPAAIARSWAVCGHQRRLQRGKIEDRCGVQRSHGRTAVHHRFHRQPQRRDRRLSRRL